MKHYSFPLLGLALALTVPASAQFRPESSERVTLNIIQTEPAIFPLSLMNTTVESGDVKVAIDVDQKGQLTDYLVTGYSRKEFADSAVKALRQWRYEPPLFRGEPWASVQELQFEYTRTGAVVTFTGFEAMSARMEELLKRSYVYRTYTLRELDRIPTPIKVVSPVSPAVGPNEKKRTVNVDFYIDEEGRVRLPSVKREEGGDAYAASALDAVRQWRFEPPLHKGQPVTVVARQQFNFVSKPEAREQK
jgi:TonB family protein